MRRKTSASMSSRGCWEEWSRRAPRCGRPSATVKMNCGNCERSERRATKGRKGQLISTHTHTHISVKLSTYQLSVNSVFNSVL